MCSVSWATVRPRVEAGEGEGERVLVEEPRTGEPGMSDEEVVVVVCC